MKKSILIVAGCLALVHGAYAQQDSKLTAAFDKILNEQFPLHNTGATALVSSHGKIIYQKAFGMANLELDLPMQVDNVFRIGSITKQFTAIAILQLMEQGKLGLQDDITLFLPGYPKHENTISIEHLLTHTSGIPDYAGMDDSLQRGKTDLSPEQVIKGFKDLPLRFVPGTKWEYSNSGYFLLGYIIEKITGKSYAAYLEDNFFRPLGMSHSFYASESTLIKKRASGYTAGRGGYENAPYLSMTQPFAAGSILSTVEDLFKWQQAVISYKLVKKENLGKAFTKYTLTGGKETAYGYGWRMGNVYESPSLWHGGRINGFMTMAVYLPKEDVFVAVFSNCDCHSPEVATNKLAALAAGRAYEHNEMALPAEMLPGYAGVYMNQKNQQRIITVSGNKLFSQLGRGPKSLLKAFEKDKFFYDTDAMATLEFSRNKNAAIEGLVTGNLKGKETWHKTNKPIPGENGIAVPEEILQNYVGLYEVSPEFKFEIMKAQSRLFLKATGQEKVEIFAETATTFFLKVNDAQLEFVKDATGKTGKALLKQGGRETSALKIK